MKHHDQTTYESLFRLMVLRHESVHRGGETGMASKQQTEELTPSTESKKQRESIEVLVF